MSGPSSVIGMFIISTPNSSDETVERFAKLKPAADDFRIFWDNAYTVHHLYDDKQAEIPNILELCEKEGNPVG